MTTIRQAADLTGLSAHAIRFYEKEGMITVPRTKNGVRDFDEASIDTLKAISHYRRAGMSLANIKQVIAEFHNHELSTRLLEETKRELDYQLHELKQTQRYLADKIKIHRKLAIKIHRKLAIKIHRKLAKLQAEGFSEEERLEACLAIRKGQDPS